MCRFSQSKTCRTRKWLRVMARKTDPTPATVELVWIRDNGSCARCCRGLSRPDRGRSWSVHHRRPRGVGGTSLAWVNLPANLVLLCGSGVTGCHGWVESHRGEAIELGWLVSRLGYLLAEDIPVQYHDGLYRLDDDGGREKWKGGEVNADPKYET